MAERDAEFVEVVYATPARQDLVRVRWRSGLTAEQAVRQSGLLEAFPEIEARPLVLGVFGMRVELERALAAGDRVEICRPLIADPRDMRRMLASRGAVMGESWPASSRKRD